MKLSLKIHDKTYTIESEEGYDGSNVYELAEQFKGLLVNAGFHPSNVDSIFNLDCQWFTDEENEGNMQGHLKEEDLSLHSRAYEAHEQDVMEKLVRDRKVQDYQDNLYKQEESDEDDIFK